MDHSPLVTIIFVSCPCSIKLFFIFLHTLGIDDLWYLSVNDLSTAYRHLFLILFPFLLSICHQRTFLHYHFTDLSGYYLITFTSISSLDLMICQGSSYFDLHLPFLLRSYFPNSGIFFQNSISEFSPKV